jgi:hypothetical protein
MFPPAGRLRATCTAPSATRGPHRVVGDDNDARITTLAGDTVPGCSMSTR